jgi:hypothetical protein
MKRLGEALGKVWGAKADATAQTKARAAGLENADS